MPFQSSISLDLTIVKNFKILTILKCNQTSYLLVPGDPVVRFGRDQYRSKGLGKDYRLKLVTCQWLPLFISKNVFSTLNTIQCIPALLDKGKTYLVSNPLPDSGARIRIRATDQAVASLTF